MLEIYVDGSSEGNSLGPGGYGIYMKYKDQEIAICGGEVPSTNNRMELMGAIVALEQLPKKTDSEIIIYSDSQYVINGITQWIKNWRKTRFKGIKNQDLWKRLDKAKGKHNVKWTWVKGHNGNYGNELADDLAKKGKRLVATEGQDYWMINERIVKWHT